MDKQSKLHLTDLVLNNDEITFIMTEANGTQEQMIVKFVDAYSSEFFYKMLSWSLNDNSLLDGGSLDSQNTDRVEMKAASERGKAYKLCKQFVALVAKDVKKERDVHVYATKLGITPNYLSVVVKRFTGKSPSEIISDYTISYAKQFLSRTNMSCKQISDALNFPNQSFFGKYFKKETGFTPGGYRHKGRQIL